MNLKLVNDEYIAYLEREQARASKTALEKLKADLKRKIHEAYLKLPCPVDYPKGQYRVPIKPEFNAAILNWNNSNTPDTEWLDWYEFIKVNGRWAMTENEMNRHIYKGIYI